ncbi:unnamed protein product, partial [Discosporangium mesarthrocarpum]
MISSVVIDELPCLEETYSEGAVTQSSLPIDIKTRDKAREEAGAYAGAGTVMRTGISEGGHKCGGAKRRSHHGLRLRSSLLYCGDTKGNLYVFHRRRNQQREGLDAVEEAGADRGLLQRGKEWTDYNNTVQPSSVMKHQHSRDQVSCLALHGECLISTGHDGFVNIFVVSFLLPPHASRSSPNSSGLLSPFPVPPKGAAWSERARRMGENCVVSLSKIACYPGGPLTT